MRKTVWMFMALLCCAAFLSTSLIMAEAQGDDKKGKAYFKESCKSCHAKDGEGGEVSPLNKTMSQWERYFKKGTHNNKTEKLEDVVPVDQLIHIETFLVNHAADSDQPETCG